MKVRPQSNNDSIGNANGPGNLIPVEAEGFHAFTDAFALDGQWVVFFSVAGHKDAVKAIRARLLTNHWVNAGMHEICLLPRSKYATIVRTLPCGITHTAIFMKDDPAQSQVRYALAANPGALESDLYFTTLIKHSAVPVHSGWKAWLHKRAVKNKEIGTLTAHGIQGIKVCLNDEGLAEDISAALKDGKLKRHITNDSPLPFPRTSSRI